jgi:hypothetical protein
MSLVGCEVRAVTRVHQDRGVFYEITFGREGHQDQLVLVPTNKLFDGAGDWLDDLNVPTRIEGRVKP